MFKPEGLRNPLADTGYYAVDFFDVGVAEQNSEFIASGTRLPGVSVCSCISWLNASSSALRFDKEVSSSIDRA